MATDATGTPTSPDNLPTYNTAGDPPSGKGFNAAMAAIQTALTARIKAALMTGVGDLIYSSGVGVAARLGIGSTGQVLTVAGGLPAWATPSGGGLVKLGRATLGASGVNFDVNLAAMTGYTSYENIKIVAKIAINAAGHDAVQLQLMTGAGPTAYTGLTYYHNHHYSQLGTLFGYDGGNGVASWRLGYAPGTGSSYGGVNDRGHFEYSIFNVQSATQVQNYLGNGAGGGANVYYSVSGGKVTSIAAAITGLRFFTNAGSQVLAGSTVDVYGYA